MEIVMFPKDRLFLSKRSSCDVPYPRFPPYWFRFQRSPIQVAVNLFALSTQSKRSCFVWSCATFFSFVSLWNAQEPDSTTRTVRPFSPGPFDICSEAPDFAFRFAAIFLADLSPLQARLTRRRGGAKGRRSNPNPTTKKLTKANVLEERDERR